MTRARELARLGNENVLSVEEDSLEVGINSTKPTSALDVRGQLNVGTAIKAGVAGVITASQFSGNITGTSVTFTDGTFTGNVTIGGTLTYEDVTNIDSVGIVTARAGVNVSGGQLLVGSGVTIGNAGVATFSGTSDIHLLDNVKLNAGDGSDLSLYHDGSNSYIDDSGTGNLYIRGSASIELRKAGGTEKMLYAEPDAAVELYWDNSKKFETSGGGTITTGIATATGLDVADKITHTGDANTAIRFPSADTVSVETGGSEALRVDSGGRLLIKETSVAGSAPLCVGNGGQELFEFTPGSATYNGGLLEYIHRSDGNTRPDLNMYVAGAGAFKVYTSGANERLRVESGGDVGINTSNPTVKLDISEDGVAFPSAAGSTLLRLRNSGGTATISIDSAANANSVIQFGDTAAASVGTIQYSHVTNHLQFNTNGDGEKMRILSNGRVAIGTDEATSTLQVYGANNGEGTATGQLTLKDTAAYNASPTAGVIFQGHHASNNSQAIFAAIRGFKANAADGDYDGCLGFDVRTHGAVAYEAMRINELGSIGINTTSPNRRFTLYQDATTRMNLKSLADSTVGIEFGDPDDENIGYLVYDNTDNSMQFGINAGERVRINQYGMMGLSVTSPDALLSVLAQNSNTPPFVIQNPDNDENFTISTYHDSNGIYGCIGANYKLNSGGSAVVDTTDHRTAGIFFDGRNNGNISFETNSAGNQPAERLKITQYGGFSFNNAELVERVKITAGKLSDNTNIDLENGMVHYFTTQETTTSTPNIRVSSSTNLNDVMATGDVVTVTIITTAAAAGYSAQMTIDSGSRTEEWVGGSAPSAGGSDGLDVYTYTIIKTGNGAYTVLANLTNCSN